MTKTSKLKVRGDFGGNEFAWGEDVQAAAAAAAKSLQSWFSNKERPVLSTSQAGFSRKWCTRGPGFHVRGMEETRLSDSQALWGRTEMLGVGSGMRKWSWAGWQGGSGGVCDASLGRSRTLRQCLLGRGSFRLSSGRETKSPGGLVVHSSTLYCDIIIGKMSRL